MSYWNYRVVHSVSNGEDVYQVHEVGYDENGKMKDVTADAVPVIGNTMAELCHDLALQLIALQKPVVEIADIPEGEQ